MKHSLLLLALWSVSSFAAVVQKPVAYDIGKTKFEGVLVYDEAGKPNRPGLVLVPNWFGINAANLKQAELIASQGYSVLVADMYGQDARPTSQEEAGKAAGAVKGDRKLMRERVNKAFDVLKANAKAMNVDTKKLGAIGFCFGGTSVLELARSGTPVAGVVSFHGNLDTPLPADAKTLKAKVLALHGADDPNVPAKDVDAFQTEMRAAKADWQLVAYGNSVHSFTDVDAKMPGKAEYNASTARRAYQAMNDFFAEIFGG